MQIQRHGAPLQMSIAGEHGQFTGRVVHVDSQDRKSAYRNNAVRESNPHLTGAAGLHFKVAQSALEDHLGRA
jgi:hypothetical protein